MGKNNRSRDNTKTMQFEAVRQPHDREQPRQAYLTVIRGGIDLGCFRVVEKHLLIGRDPNCCFPLHDLGISWEHARIDAMPDGHYQIRDLGSTNGTLLNGRAIQKPVELREGDKIFLGEIVVRFSLADEIDLRFQQEVSHLVNQDPLTGLESKRAFDEALEYALEQSRQNAKPLSILMMDLDGIKPINDSHGHLFGAFTIGQAGKIIGSILSGVGRACRFGGDEFTAFIPGKTKEQARTVAETIRSSIETADLTKDNIRLAPTISIGVSAYPEDGDHETTLVAAADAALYRAKSAGKNRVSF